MPIQLKIEQNYHQKKCNLKLSFNNVQMRKNADKSLPQVTKKQIIVKKSIVET